MGYKNKVWLRKISTSNPRLSIPPSYFLSYSFVFTPMHRANSGGAFNNHMATRYVAAQPTAMQVTLLPYSDVFNA